MLSSAIASSSAVVTPARTWPRSSSSVRPTTRPARRIASICSGVLISTPRSKRVIAASPPPWVWARPPRLARPPSAGPPPRPGSGLRDDVEGVEDSGGDLVDLTHAVDLDDDAALLVDLDQRLGLLEVDLLAATDDVLGVIGPSFDLGALQQPADDLVLVGDQAHHRVELVPGEADHPVELLDLGQGAGVPVEQEAVGGVRLVDAVADHPVGDLVGDVVTGVHVPFGLDPELGAL